jgi:hypothetical protein
MRHSHKSTAPTLVSVFIATWLLSQARDAFIGEDTSSTTLLYKRIMYFRRIEHWESVDEQPISKPDPIIWCHLQTHNIERKVA